MGSRRLRTRTPERTKVDLRNRKRTREDDEKDVSPRVLKSPRTQLAVTLSELDIGKMGVPPMLDLLSGPEALTDTPVTRVFSISPRASVIRASAASAIKNICRAREDARRRTYTRSRRFTWTSPRDDKNDTRTRGHTRGVLVPAARTRGDSGQNYLLDLCS